MEDRPCFKLSKLENRPKENHCRDLTTLQQTAPMVLTPMAGFSSYHNFCYKLEGIVVSRAYGIRRRADQVGGPEYQMRKTYYRKGQRKRKEFSSVTSRRIRLPTLQEEEADIVDNVCHQCNEPGYSYVSANFEAMQDHVNFGKHGFNSKDNEGIYDRLRREWAHKFATLKNLTFNCKV